MLWCVVAYLLMSYLCARAFARWAHFEGVEWTGIDTFMSCFCGLVWPVALPTIVAIEYADKRPKRNRPPRWLMKEDTDARR